MTRRATIPIDWTEEDDIEETAKSLENTVAAIGPTKRRLVMRIRQMPIEDTARIKKMLAGMGL